MSGRPEGSGVEGRIGEVTVVAAGPHAEAQLRV